MAVSLFVVAVAVLFVSIALGFGVDSSRAWETQFVEYTRRFNKKYVTEEERHIAMENYIYNMQRVNELQAKNPHAQFGETVLTDKRFNSQRINTRERIPASTTTSFHSMTPLPLSIDWRQHGAVGPVPTQGMCACPESFAIVGAAQGAWVVQGGHRLVLLSPQQLISCATGEYWDGCNGCVMFEGLEWLIKSNGGRLDTEASFPYNSTEGISPPCKTQGVAVGATIQSWETLPHNESEMASFLVGHGPFSACMDADHWCTYQGGVMTDCARDNINHCAVVVGFNRENASLPYWIIQNQFGTEWGENGYLFLAMGSDQCGITNRPAAVLVV